MHDGRWREVTVDDPSGTVVAYVGRLSPDTVHNFESRRDFLADQLDFFGKRARAKEADDSSRQIYGFFETEKSIMDQAKQRWSRGFINPVLTADRDGLWILILCDTPDNLEVYAVIDRDSAAHACETALRVMDPLADAVTIQKGSWTNLAQLLDADGQPGNPALSRVLSQAVMIRQH